LAEVWQRFGPAKKCLFSMGAEVAEVAEVYLRVKDT
jgi:hypothetical protein